MMGVDHTNRTAFHRALLASITLHLALAGAIVVAVRSQPAPAPVSPRIDTGVDVVVRMFDAGPVLDAPAPNLSPAAPVLATEHYPSEPRPAPLPEIARTPQGRIAPRSLSAEALAAISRSMAARHVAASSPGVPAIHGAMKQGQSVVYILDCSGSMGEHGKLELARAALLATLKSLPAGVRFQVIVYDGSARPLLPGAECLLATALNIETIAAKLEEREAVGRSNHLEALRAAVRYRPDAIFLLSDTKGLNRDQIRPVLAQLQKPTYIYLARVSASNVETPHELR